MALTPSSNHLAQDIQPYTCILEDCPTPDSMFATRAAWIDHMQYGHGSVDLWDCPFCEPSEVFNERGLFQIHLQTTHSNDVSDSEDFASVYASTPPPTITSCPLCSWAQEQGDGYEVSDLIDHIAEHVHCFGLMALPWRSASIPSEKGHNEVEEVAEVDEVDDREEGINHWLRTVEPLSETSEGLIASVCKCIDGEWPYGDTRSFLPLMEHSYGG